MWRGGHPVDVDLLLSLYRRFSLPPGPAPLWPSLDLAASTVLEKSFMHATTLRLRFNLRPES